MSRSPFKFLDAYQKDDRDIYFGRETETEELYDRVYETNLVLLYGASGTGKTSLINCGLANMFENTDWHPISIRRREHMIAAMNAEIQKNAITPFKEGANLIERVRSLYLDYFKPIYLIFDQFEEIFILGNKEEQDLFFANIFELLNSGLQCKVVLSMREEYIALLSDFERVVPSLFENRFRIEKMGPRNLERVVLETAKAFNIDLQDGKTTISKILENLKDKQEGVELANLQVYLDRLYRLDMERNGGGENAKPKFDPDLVDQAGQLDDVMADFLEEQLQVLDAELAQNKVTHKNLPMEVLFALVTDTGTKQSANVPALRQSLQERKKVDPQWVDYCLKRFMEMRIIRDLGE